jgi:hypothetical protein
MKSKRVIPHCSQSYSSYTNESGPNSPVPYLRPKSRLHANRFDVSFFWIGDEHGVVSHEVLRAQSRRSIKVNINSEISKVKKSDVQGFTVKGPDLVARSCR